MSIVIRELVIRARLEEGEPGSSCHTNGSTKTGGNSPSADANTDRIVALCTEKVMEALERKKER